MRRRNNLDIVADIIKVIDIDGSALISKIIYKANLNFNIGRKYLKRMIEYGLIKRTRNRYYLQPKSETFMNGYKQIKNF